MKPCQPAHCDALILLNSCTEFHREVISTQFPPLKIDSASQKGNQFRQNMVPITLPVKIVLRWDIEVQGSNIISPCTCTLKQRELVLMGLNHAGRFSRSGLSFRLRARKLEPRSNPAVNQLCVPGKPINFWSRSLLIPYKVSLAINTVYAKTFQEVWGPKNVGYLRFLLWPFKVPLSHLFPRAMIPLWLASMPRFPSRWHLLTCSGAKNIFKRTCSINIVFSSFENTFTHTISFNPHNTTLK